MSKPEEELIAERFAAALLMPKLVVENAFVRRGWMPSRPTPEQVFVIAQDLGVGFTTLVDHMTFGLRILASPVAKVLSRASLSKLRAAWAGREVAQDVFPVDAQWGVRPLDVEVGDIVASPAGGRHEGVCFTENQGGLLVSRPGSARLWIPGRKDPIKIRASRTQFAGLARYRHLEDVDD